MYSQLKYFVLLACILLSISLKASLKTNPKKIRLSDLRCENLVRPNAIDNNSPHFSWKTSTPDNNMHQTHYQIQVATDSVELLAKKIDLWDSGKTKSSSFVMIPYSGKTLSSRQLCYWRVRVWNEKGQASAWSDVQRFGIGIISNDKIKGNFIGLAANQSPLIRKKINISQEETAFLHINSLGYFEVYINGKKVGNDVLSPAVSHLDKRSLITTYDVSAYLHKGENDIVFWLGTGWYKKTTGFDVTFDGAIVRAQLDLLQNKEWKTVLTTDKSWIASPSGYRDTGPWTALQFAGERVDAKLNPLDFTTTSLDARSWSQVDTVSIPYNMATPQMSEPNKIQHTYTATTTKHLGNDTWLIDMGKALNGWFEIDFQNLKPNQEIVIEYSDFINKEGIFEDQGQKDIYIAAGNGKEKFINKFNHHAFQYVRISNIKTLPPQENIKGHLIHTDFKSTSSFSCSDEDLNRIHDMIQYTMRNLSFSGYMVDCPHLERAGYGGDGNSSTNTLQTMYAASPLFHNWLQAWSDSMREGGSLPHVAPNPGAGGGGPYWCSFLIMASWRTYVNYGDSRLIERYYPIMKEWLKYVEKYTVDGLLQRWPDTKYRDWFLGDWLAPMGVDSGAQSSISLVNNCAISECLGMMAKMAEVLGYQNDISTFKTQRENLNKLLHLTFFDEKENTYATGSQLDMTYPMLLGITPVEKYELVKQKLLDISAEKHNNHIAVGLVGVPILTQWVIENNAVDFMYSMLKKRDYPGYLYMIDNGASTTWEYWSGERSRIHNCYNGIGTWFYQGVGGIKVDEDNPGYRHAIISPQIPQGLTWANTTINTVYGDLMVNWKIENNKLQIDIDIPIGSQATFICPKNFKILKLNNKNAIGKNKILLDSGKYHVELIHVN